LGSYIYDEISDLNFNSVLFSKSWGNSRGAYFFKLQNIKVYLNAAGLYDYLYGLAFIENNEVSMTQESFELLKKEGVEGLKEISNFYERCIAAWVYFKAIEAGKARGEPFTKYLKYYFKFSKEFIYDNGEMNVVLSAPNREVEELLYSDVVVVSLSKSIWKSKEKELKAIINAANIPLQISPLRTMSLSAINRLSEKVDILVVVGDASYAPKDEVEDSLKMSIYKSTALPFGEGGYLIVGIKQ